MMSDKSVPTVLDCVFGNLENVQTVYKVCKLYCALLHRCVKIGLTRFMSA